LIYTRPPQHLEGGLFHAYLLVSTDSSSLCSFSKIMSIDHHYEVAAFNAARLQTIDWLYDQIAAGFNPEWFGSVHFRCPTETGSHRKGSNDVSQKALMQYRGNTRRRNSSILVSRDAVHISRLLQSTLWSSRPGTSGRNRRSNPVPTLFVVERGSAQLHLHFLIPRPLDVPNTAAAIDHAWHASVVPRSRCLSSSERAFLIKPITDLLGLLYYVTKQVTEVFPAVDYQASTFSATPPLEPSHCTRTPPTRSLNTLPQRPPVPWPPKHWRL